MVAERWNQHLGISCSAYSLAYKLAVHVEARPNQVTPQVFALHSGCKQKLSTSSQHCAPSCAYNVVCDNKAKQKAQAAVNSDVRPRRQKSQTSKTRLGKMNKKRDFWKNKKKKKTSGINTKSHYWNPAQMSKTSNLVLMNPALKKVIWGWTIYRGIIYLKGWEIIGGYNQRLKRTVLGQFGKITQAVIFEGFKDAVCQLQPNTKKNVNKKWKNRL